MGVPGIFSLFSLPFPSVGEKNQNSSRKSKVMSFRGICPTDEKRREERKEEGECGE